MSIRVLVWGGVNGNRIKSANLDHHLGVKFCRYRRFAHTKAMLSDLPKPHSLSGSPRIQIKEVCFYRYILRPCVKRDWIVSSGICPCGPSELPLTCRVDGRVTADVLCSGWLGSMLSRSLQSA